MKCELCHKNEAETVIFRERPGKAREELYVCRPCAEREEAFGQERGIQVAAMEFSPDDLPPGVNPGLPPGGTDEGWSPPKPSAEAFHELGKMFDQISSLLSGSGNNLDEARCPACGQTLEEIRSSGLVGCPKCYEVFREAIVPLLAELNDCTAFGGTFGVAKQVNAQEQLQALKRALVEAIQREDYAAAKQLKAEIEALKRALGDAEQGGAHGA
ncbi:MAG: hypothetical protein ACI4RT_02675 [Candidatus Spyradenecus sp.]